jgi:ABC-type amino acid transport system permease subunit
MRNVPILIQVELLFFGRFAAFGGGDDVLMSR